MEKFDTGTDGNSGKDFGTGIKPLPTPAPIITLADGLRIAESGGTLSAAQLRDCRGAANKLMNALHRDSLADVPLSPAALGPLLEKVVAYRFGCSKRRMYNLKSALVKLAVAAGVHDDRGMTHCKHTAAFRALSEGIPDQFDRFEFNRFFSYCTARGITPEMVNDAVIVAFNENLRTRTFAGHISLVVRNVVRGWNRRAGVVPGWPATMLTGIAYKRTYSLPLSDFPESFQNDLAAFLKEWEAPRRGSAAYMRLGTGQHSPYTITAYRGFAIRAASILVLEGMPVADVRSLADLVQPRRFEQVLFFLDRRAGGGKNNQAYVMGTCLAQIAEYWVKAPKPVLEDLKRQAAAGRTPHLGISHKIRRRMQELTTPSRMQRLTGLSAKLAADARRLLPTAPKRAAIVMENAVAIELLLRFAMRRRTLAMVRLDDFVRTERGRIVALSLDGARVKNGNDIEGPIKRDFAALLRSYQTEFRPIRPGAPGSPWLFPSVDGGYLNPEGLAHRLAAVLKGELGTAISLHDLRHLAATRILANDPNGIGTAQMVLGHRSSKTTERQYGVMRQAAASANWGHQLDSYGKSKRGK